MVKIPFGRPARAGRELPYLMDAVRQNQYSAGKFVADFERQVAEYVGAKHAIAVNSGTSALHLALLAAGVGPGDEVIVPALTFASTAFAVSYTGATPVIVDVDPETWCIDPTAVMNAVDDKTRAVIPVHLYGARARVGIYWSRNHWLIEDACEAWGTSDVGEGEMACFSLQGSKAIQAGEGGVIVTNSKINADKIRHLRGQAMTDKRYWHDAVGYNYRMTELQGAVACAQIEMIDCFVRRRQVIMALCRELLPDLTFQKNDGCWAPALLLPDKVDRDTVIDQMLAAGIETRPVFYPLNHLPPYRADGCPIAAEIAAHGIVLPCYPDLTDEDVKTVCKTLQSLL